jgi:Flp pilus assembly secretin CpaC
MTALCLAGRSARNALPRNVLHWLAAAVLFAAIAGQTIAKAAAQPPVNEPIYTRLDEATLFKLPDRAATVVVGNPLIADVTIQTGGIAVLTGKGYGGTNIVVMDNGGVVLMEKAVVVTSPPDHVVFVYRGASRTTYSCNPDCSTRVNLGDDPDVFDKILGQTVSRTTQAIAAGSGASGQR